MHVPRSRVDNIFWPAIPEESGAMMLAMQWQLDQSQWWSAETLLQMQFRQLEWLLRQAAESIPYYREQLLATGIDLEAPMTKESWQKVPLLSRDVLQNRGDELRSPDIGNQHGDTFEKTTSGSTGQSMTIIGTDADNLFWQAITIRDHLWHRRRFTGRYVSIRSGRYKSDPKAVYHYDVWGSPTSYIYDTGPSTVFYHMLPIEDQVKLLVELQPEYLLTYPTNAMMLAKYCRKHNLKLSELRGVIAYGELLQPEVRQDCMETWGVPVTDMYSCEEVGYIALQCPDYQHYHCQSESVMVEVLNDAGEACEPGEIGRVVLTSLHNFAMPLIRYVNRDYAEVGLPCPCGRGATTIKRVVGRERNMALGLDGKKFWPNFNRSVWSAFEEVDEIQLVQTERDHFEIKAVGHRPLDLPQQRKLESAICESLGYTYRFSYQHLFELPRHANGKYERFIRLPSAI
jgi:phenylacetate-CoA ligase